MAGSGAVIICNSSVDDMGGNNGLVAGLFDGGGSATRFLVRSSSACFSKLVSGIVVFCFVDDHLRRARTGALLCDALVSYPVQSTDFHSVPNQSSRHVWCCDSNGWPKSGSKTDF